MTSPEKPRLEQAPESSSADDPSPTSGEDRPADPPTPGTASKIPQTIAGRYQIKRVLGKGGFGLVYLAFDTQLERCVAIKTPHTRLVARPEEAQTYIKEARIVAGLDHPNIVPVYDANTSTDCPFFVVSKYIEGSTLAQSLRQRRFSFDEAAQLVAKVADALHHAHTRGLVHRDVKPSNILLDKSGRPFVVDFGLAMREQEFGKVPCYAGTPAYMSPEQARGEGHRVDGRSDLFSLGLVLYELLSGRYPFPRESMSDLIWDIINVDVRPLRQIDDGIPRELERICLTALSKRPSERYATARDMAEELWQWHEQEMGTAGSGISERGPGPTLGGLYNVPETPPHFLLRPGHLRALKDSVLGETGSPIALTGKARVGLQGMGGIGKSVLAAALARDVHVQRAFPDGIFWVPVGQTPSLTALQQALVQELGGAAEVFDSPSAGRARLRTLLAERACLLILDDVWQAEAVTAFDALGPAGRMVLTTRDGALITALGAVEQRLDVLDEEQALGLLAAWSGQGINALPALVREVAHECGNLPLALAVCGAMARDGVPWQDLLNALREADLTFLDRSCLDYPYHDVLRSLSVSVEALARADPLAARCYQILAVLPADEAVPEGAVLTLWQAENDLKDRDARKILITLERKALLLLDGEAPQRRIRFHDLQHDYLRAAQGDLQGLHRRVLEAYRSRCPGNWASGPNDGYFFQHLPRHLAAAGCQQELQMLLLDFGWLQTKLANTGITGMLADFALAIPDKATQLVQSGLRLSAHILAEEPKQLAGQLLGRLLGQSAVQALLDSAARLAPRPWLRPVQECLTSPGGSLLRTLKGHEAGIVVLAVSPDGTVVVSGAEDGTLIVWDLVTGWEKQSLRGHSAAITAVTISPDGKSAISASHDRTIRVWNLATGRTQRKLKQKGHWVKALALTGGGKVLISASSDGVLTHWDLQTGTGQVLHTGETIEHRGRELPKAMITGLALALDEQTAISGDSDGLVQQLSLSDGQCRQITRHRFGITALALTPDGRSLVYASDQGTLKVWDWPIAKERRSMPCPGHEINALAITPDSSCVITASEDQTLRTWDLITGTVLRVFKGHSGAVRAVAVTPEGRSAISGSADGTLKIWDLTQRRSRPASLRLQAAITTVAVSPDGKWLLSGSADGALKLWDVPTGHLRATLVHGGEHINALAISPDGKWAAAGRSSRSLRIWDLTQIDPVASGRQPKRTIPSITSPSETIDVPPMVVGRNLRGHGVAVTSVTFTPDARFVISGAANGVVMVWKLTTGEAVRSFLAHEAGVKALLVTPDQAWIVTGACDRPWLRFWALDSDAGRQFSMGHNGGIRTLAITPDGRLLASASEDRSVRLRDLASGGPRQVLHAHSKTINALAISPSGRMLFSASADRSMIAWDLATGDLVTRYTGDSEFLCCAVAAQGDLVIAGDRLGRAHFLRFEPSV
jgi:WD40 repeat protein